MYITKEIVIPLFFAALLALALNPLANWMNGHGVNRTLAIALSLLAVIGLVGALVMFLVSQVSMFRSSTPTMMTKFHELLQTAHVWLLQQVGMDPIKIDAWMDKPQSGGDAKPVEAVNKVSNTIIQFVLVSIYAFLILHYKALWLGFLKKKLTVTNMQI